MKFSLPFLLFSILVTNSFAQERTASLDKTLPQHLTNVNKLWPAQNTLRHSEEAFIIDEDKDRIQLHFESVYQLLKNRSTDHLSKSQKQKREHNLELIRSYGFKGVFPKNTFHENRQPYFVDIYETRCAVAHLVEESGKTDLLNQIRKESNYEYVEALVDLYPSLEEWGVENGFTVEEVKLIQPNYSWHQYMHSIGNGGGVDGDINVMETSEGGGLLYFAGDFTEVDGVAANSIISWDGESWNTVGEGVDGEIFDLHFHNNLLHVSGHFKLFGESEFTNIAYYDGNSWVALQTGDSGVIYTMESYDERLYIGGAFQSLDGQPHSYLAYYDADSLAWLNNGVTADNGTLYSVPNVFAVDDTVRSLKVYKNVLLVGGDFENVMPEVTDPNFEPRDLKYFARWFGYVWLPGNLTFEDVALDYEKTGVSMIGVFDTTIYVTGELDEPDYSYLLKYDNNSFFSTTGSQGYWNQEGAIGIQGFIRHNEDDFFYGNNSSGLDNILGGLDGEFNDEVTAAAVYKGNIYLAGKFTEAFEVPLNGLAYSAWNSQPVSTDDIPEEKQIKIYNVGGQLFFEGEAMANYSNVHIYSIDGKRLKSASINAGDNRVELNSSFWNTGVYVYQLIGKKEFSGGTFVIH